MCRAKYKVSDRIVKVGSALPLVELGAVTNLAMKPLRSSPRSRLLPILSFALIAAAIIIGILTAVSGNSSGGMLPNGSIWGGVPVGGLSLDDAAARVGGVFSEPIDFKYRGQTIQVSPQQLGFQLNLEAMRTRAARSATPTFWDRLWNRTTAAAAVALDFSVDGEKLRAYLQDEIAARYDQPAHAAMPIPGTTNFTPGSDGWQLDIQQSATRISAALASPSQRTVDLIVNDEKAPSSDSGDLRIFLNQTLALSRFTGIAEVYLNNPATGEQLHFALRNGEEISPDIAYSAASTMKIPIMVSVLSRTSEPLAADIQSLLERMIELSENPPADTLMENIIGGTTAPLTVTRDMQERLDLKNTFLAGYFYFGAPLLNLYTTPANTRPDVNLDPDIYNQTTTSDMGRLLTGIYQCSRGEENLLTKGFGSEITPFKCTAMLDILSKNKIGVLSEAGVPDGTRVAHKHGWTEESDGFLHTVSDAGVVYSPGGDFVFVIFLYDQNQLLFDPADAAIARLVQVIYNYYNPRAQARWLGEPMEFPQR